MNRTGPGWQLLLADLSLILFLFTLATLGRGSNGDAEEPALPVVAASQALYRPGADAPTLARWLAERPRDPRATVTVFAQHTGTDETAVWSEARRLSRMASGAGYKVRVVVTHGERSDLYASLAYDDPLSQVALR